MTDKYNKAYNNMNIPDDKLLEAIDSGIKKGQKYLFKRKIKKISYLAASIALVGFISANIPFIYIEASKLPLIGDFVQAVHIGSGGEDYLGSNMSVVRYKNSIEIKYGENENIKQSVKPYNIQYGTAPYRMEISFKNMSKKEYENLKENLLSIDAVQDVYQVPSKQKEYTRFNVILNRLTNYEVMEFKNPGRLNLSFFQDAYYSDNDIPPEQNMYVVITDEYDDVKKIDNFEKLYFLENSSIIKTKNKKYLISFGEFENENDAKKKLVEVLNIDKNLNLKIKKIQAKDCL